MRIKDASKFMSLEKLYEIRDNSYRGVHGNDYDSDTIDSMIWKKQTEQDERNVLKALQEMDKLEIITVGR